MDIPGTTIFESNKHQESFKCVFFQGKKMDSLFFTNLFLIYTLTFTDIALVVSNTLLEFFKYILVVIFCTGCNKMRACVCQAVHNAMVRALEALWLLVGITFPRQSNHIARRAYVPV